MFRYLLIVLIAAVELIKCSCVINLTKDLTKLSPIFMKNGYVILPSTSKGDVTLRSNESITLFCSGPRNFFTIDESFKTLNMLQVVCKENQKLEIDGKDITDFRNVTCKKPHTVDVMESKVTCADSNGSLITVGYSISSTFLKLYEVCHDQNVGRTFYSKHTLYGQFIKYAQKESSRPSFGTMGYSKSIPINLVYKKVYQKGRFNQLLNSAKLSENYINNSSFLSRGHLAPDGDFLYASWQYASSLYINTSPQWSTMNSGNWRSLESKIRKFANRMQKNVTIYTGVYGLMTVKNNLNIDQEVYMTTNKKVPVPKYFWKLIELDDKGILFVSLNDPFVKVDDGDNVPNFCNNKCKQNCWFSNSFNVVRKGLTWCCEITNQLTKSLSLSNLKINGVLRNC